MDHTAHANITLGLGCSMSRQSDSQINIEDEGEHETSPLLGRVSHDQAGIPAPEERPPWYAIMLYISQNTKAPSYHEYFV